MSLDSVSQQCPNCLGEGQNNRGECCWLCGGSGKIDAPVVRDDIVWRARAFVSSVEGVIWLIITLAVAGLAAYLILKR